ncbi:MAG: hypothetical protein Kow0070_26570 [Anaerolineales bacterium]
MTQTTKRTLILLMAGILLLAACAPAPAAAPTTDPAEIQRQVQQIVALTIDAQKALTEQAQAAQPTNTPLPTQTEAVLLPSPTSIPPTATLIVLPSPTAAPVSSGGSGSVPPVPREYACAIVNQSPANFSVWKPNKDFDVTWTLVNTGTKSWRGGSDLVFQSGTNLAKQTAIELPAVAPGDKIKVVLDAVSPSKAGTYTMVWKLEGGFCLPSLIIKVEK